MGAGRHLCSGYWPGVAYASSTQGMISRLVKTCLLCHTYHGTVACPVEFTSLTMARTVEWNPLPFAFETKRLVEDKSILRKPTPG